jgi:hypothetical protein
MFYEISSTYISERYRKHLSAGMSHLQACSHIHPPADASVMFQRSFELVKRCLVKNKRLAQLWSEPHEGFAIVWPDIKEASRHDSIVIPPKRIETKQKAKVGRPSNYYLRQKAKNPDAWTMAGAQGCDRRWRAERVEAHECAPVCLRHTPRIEWGCHQCWIRIYGRLAVITGIYPKKGETSMNQTYFETQEEKQLHDDAYYQAILDENEKHLEAIINENNG